ncbi:MAG: Integral membrane protein [uncultured Nocardioidaceae bacterium]|uniref:Integral membrane protein n=1 Tax=uncultured Nocardioidaceae bacterium TaxID=253824 RepID=A0A6J4KWU7_9ACTN|nr:MAG: Integral membrane protein [uncultured Nocardioidaceae bacterium]
MVLKTFGWSFAITAAGLVAGLWLGGPTALLLVAILCVLEISLSFDNAVVNATILERMDAFWQKMFLTIGILIAVFGMRLVFPLLIVGVTASLNPIEAVQLAAEGGDIEEPGTYAYLLHEAHPTIAAFGGMFLLMLFLDFVFEDRDIKWLTWLEAPLARIGKLDQLSVVVALGALVLAVETLATEHAETVMVSGVLGVVTYLLVNGLGELFEAGGQHGDADELADSTGGPEGVHGSPSGKIEIDRVSGGGPSELAKASGKAGFFLFLYLEVIDASFSFDGVIGAFAITQDIFIIAIGLGVGAMYIRSLTVYLVKQGTLGNYVYLEHGAMWAIGALATILLITIEFEVPEVITGLIGLAFIVAAFASSLVRNRRLAAEGEPVEQREHATADR